MVAACCKQAVTEMTHKQRLLTAMDRGVPDQVPVTWELVDRFALAATGRTGWRAMCDAHRMIGSSIFNLQGVGPHLRTSLPAGYGMDSREIGEEDGWTIREEHLITPGKTLRSRTMRGGIPGDPLTSKRIEYFVKTPEDYEVVAEYTAQVAGTSEPDTQASREALDYVGDDGVVNFWCPDPLYHLANMRPADQFVLDLIEIPDLIDQILKPIQALKDLAIEAFNASAAEVLIYDICWATTSLLNPAMVRRFIIPAARRAVQRTSRQKRIGFFTTGRIRDVLDDLVDCGPAFIQHFDCFGDCDLGEAKKQYGDRICIMGNVNPVVLAHGTVDDARTEAMRCLGDAAAGGGYILSTSDELPADARMENLRAVVETVASHGRY